MILSEPLYSSAQAAQAADASRSAHRPIRILCVTNLFPNPLQPGKGIFNFRSLKLISQKMPLRVISTLAWTDELRAGRQNRGAFCDQKWRDWEGVPVAWSRYYFTPLVLRRYYGSFF